MRDWLASFDAIAAELARLLGDRRFHYPIRHGTMRVGVYAPRPEDPQRPHQQDELYIVARGSGRFVKNGEARSFKAGDVIFVEAGAEHRFEAFGHDFATWVVFWGPPGGEAAASSEPG